MRSMSEKLSASLRLRHSQTDPQILSERMRKASHARWSRTSVADRLAIADKLLQARKDKAT